MYSVNILYMKLISQVWPRIFSQVMSCQVRSGQVRSQPQLLACNTPLKPGSQYVTDSSPTCTVLSLVCFNAFSVSMHLV